MPRADRARPTVFERRRPADARRRRRAGRRRRRLLLDRGRRRARRTPRCAGRRRADLAVVGGGYTGLWTAVRAKQRDPGRRVRAARGASGSGWAASGRNGGFCDASITHGEENGRSRWPDEYDDLERLGRENLDGIVATVAEHAHGRRPRADRRAGGRRRAAPGGVAARGGGRGRRDASSTRRRCAPRWTARRTSPGSSRPTARCCTRRRWSTSWRGWRPSWAWRSSRTAPSRGWRRSAAADR